MTQGAAELPGVIVNGHTAASVRDKCQIMNDPGAVEFTSVIVARHKTLRDHSWHCEGEGQALVSDPGAA